MAWVVQFKWERKKKSWIWILWERERDKIFFKKIKIKKEKRQQFKFSFVIKKNSSKLAYLISFTYRFKIWSHFFFLVQKAVIRIRDNKREKRDNQTTI